MLQDAPITTYRFQLHEHFTFEDAQKQLPYLQELGVTHIYLSPILAATSHSQHGYDVVDHSRINPELTSSGGDATAAFAAFVAEAKAREMMLIADIVPNHMSVAAPMSANPAWWDVLKHGQRSEYACWFDINWEHYLNHGKIALAVLGGPPDELLAKKEITLSADGTRIEYYSHQFPVAPGTLVEGDVAATLAGQHYVLVFWKEESKVLNYRRFFDIGSLAGLRVEDPKVFDATHKLMCGLVRDGTLAGLRVDHPDGLADPAGYANRLKEATDGAWVVMEKILAPDEDLPSSWPVSGTTGYDALNTVLALLAPPAAAAKTLTTFYASLVKNKAEEAAFEDVEWHSKYYVMQNSMAPEFGRIADLLQAELGSATVDGHDVPGALMALMAAFDTYRAYIEPGSPISQETNNKFDRAVALALKRCPQHSKTLALIVPALRTGSKELVVRFQQACGPVMAKGVEDTAFYRYHRCVALNEVGGNPGLLDAIIKDEDMATRFHATNAKQQQRWPYTMTALSTHDTKRSEDVRARLLTIMERADEWTAFARKTIDATRQALGDDAKPLDDATLYGVLQNVVGAWPITVERAHQFATKAAREAKQYTSWTNGDITYEKALTMWVAHLIKHEGDAIARWIAPFDDAALATSVSQKLVQLTMPGVADVYQGSETVSYSLVDPDNRRPVDYTQLAEFHVADAKQTLTRCILQLRRSHPDWFVGETSTYAPLTPGHTSNHHSIDASGHVVAYVRSGYVLVVALRWNQTLRANPQLKALVLDDRTAGNNEDAVTLTLPPGTWHNALDPKHEFIVIENQPMPVSQLLTTVGGGVWVRTA